MSRGFQKILIALLFISNSLFAQIEKQTGDEYLSELDYNAALKEFLKEEKAKPNDEVLIRKISVCYLNINDDKTKAIPYLAKLYKSGKYDDEVLFDLGRAYHYDYKFDEAIDFYNKYKEKVSTKKHGHDLGLFNNTVALR